MSSPSRSGGTWRFLIDENTTKLLTPRLLAAGHFAEDARNVGLASRPDHEVWAYAQAHDETIVTKDKDFADIRAYPTPHAGIVIADIPDAVTVAMFVQLILDGLATLSGQPLANAVVTISPGHVRVRR